MSFRERIQWLFRLAGMLFILASVAFPSAITAMRFAIQGREVVMPNVVGMNAVSARQMLQGRGLSLKVEDRAYSPLPVDAVVRQSPADGAICDFVEQIIRVVMKSFHVGADQQKR
jgi:beta-lactam-binding protein with PASTA domain